jgi:hypothetical protein
MLKAEDVGIQVVLGMPNWVDGAMICGKEGWGQFECVMGGLVP